MRTTHLLLSRATLQLAGLLGLLAALIALPARGEERPIPPGLSETIEVRVVNVEAVVTDADGVRVHGLGLADFRLLVDGEEVPIDYFTEIRGGDALAASGAAAPPGVAPGVPLATSYLVFIDEFFAIDPDRHAVIGELRRQLPQLGAADRMAVVAWNGHGLEMLSSWSASLNELDATLAAAAERRGFGLQRLAEQAAHDLGQRPAVRRAFSVDPYRLAFDERFYAELFADQLGRGAAAAAAAVRGFGAPPGRRVMLLLSGGWPFSPVDFVAGDRLRTVIEPGIAAGVEIFGPLATTANLLGYTIYPVDVPGMQAGSGISVASTSGLGRDLDFRRENEIHTTARYLAHATGGEALLNSARGHALEQAAADTRSFYWLGFGPRWTGDGAGHSIEVEVLRPGLEVRNRDAYADLPRERQTALQVESAALFGDPAGLEPLGIALGRAEKAGRGKVTVPLTVQIPAEAFAANADGRGFAARLELYVAAVDDNGASAEVPVEPITVIAAQPPAAGESVPYETSLVMRNRPHELVIAVYDPVSGKLRSGAAALEL